MTPAGAEPAVAAFAAPLLREGAASFTASPFEERWLAIERRLLGPAYQETAKVLALVSDPALQNLARVVEILRPDYAAMRVRLEKTGAPATPEELSAYVEAGLLLLYYGFGGQFPAA